MAETKNILLCGVGGQGIITASKILSVGLISAGYDVKMSEVHGMAQRGGSVTTQVRFGEKVWSPIIGLGQADILVSFETMETGKWLEYLKQDGKIVVNDYRIPSAPILSGVQDYPTGLIEALSDKADTTAIKAAELALDLGNIRTMNVVLLGALVKAMGLDGNINWDEVVKQTVKPKFVDVNIRALKAGMEMIK
jgi:indolepyruvate ferredoxin oxidoreductase beta subunit